MTNALWYISPKHGVLEEAAKHHAEVSSVPNRWKSTSNLNDPKAKKKASYNLAQNLLQQHVDALNSLLELSSLQFAPEETKSMIAELSVCLEGYAKYLKEKCEKVKEGHNRSKPAREVATDVYIQELDACSEVDDISSLIDRQVRSAESKPVCISDLEEIRNLTSVQRTRFYDSFRITVRSVLLRYCPGGSLSTIAYIWQYEGPTHTGRMITDLKPRLPEYHTRFMKKQWTER